MLTAICERLQARDPVAEGAPAGRPAADGPQAAERPLAIHVSQSVAHGDAPATLGALLAPHSPFVHFLSHSELATFMRTSRDNRNAIETIIQADPALRDAFAQFRRANAALGLHDIVHGKSPMCYAAVSAGAGSAGALSFALIPAEAGIIIGSISVAVAVVAGALFVVQCCLDQSGAQRDLILYEIRGLEEDARNAERHRDAPPDHQLDMDRIERMRARQQLE